MAAVAVCHTQGRRILLYFVNDKPKQLTKNTTDSKQIRFLSKHMGKVSRPLLAPVFTSMYHTGMKANSELKTLMLWHFGCTKYCSVKLQNFYIKLS